MTTALALLTHRTPATWGTFTRSSSTIHIIWKIIWNFTHINGNAIQPTDWGALYFEGIQTQVSCQSRLRGPSYPFVVSLTRVARGCWYLLKASLQDSGGWGSNLSYPSARLIINIIINFNYAIFFANSLNPELAIIASMNWARTKPKLTKKHFFLCQSLDHANVSFIMDRFTLNTRVQQSSNIVLLHHALARTDFIIKQVDKG